MIDLQKYVDGLFRHQRLTPEVKDLKEEILSNMIAKRDDLIAQGLSAEKATEKAKESLSAIDYLIDGNQLTDVGKYHIAQLYYFLDFFLAASLYPLCANQLYRAFMCYHFWLRLHSEQR